jgi:hypothetical protein
MPRIAGQKTRTTLGAAALLTIMVMAPGHAGEMLSVRVTPVVAYAPAALEVDAVVAADDENRSLEIEVESAEYYRSSAIELNGSRAPRVSTFQFREIPPGSYRVLAILHGSAGDRATAVRAVKVVRAPAR